MRGLTLAICLAVSGCALPDLEPETADYEICDDSVTPDCGDDVDIVIVD